MGWLDVRDEKTGGLDQRTTGSLTIGGILAGVSGYHVECMIA